MKEKKPPLLIVSMCRFPWISFVNKGMSFSTILWISCVSYTFLLGNVYIYIYNLSMTQLR